MKIERVEIKDFRGINELAIEFNDSVNILVGINGAGKSTVLDVLAMMLSWVSSRIIRHNSQGKQINDLDIKNQQSASFINIRTKADGERYSWSVARVRKGRRRKGTLSDFSRLNEYINIIHDRLENTNENCSIPLFIYYPTNRNVLEIPLRIRNSHSFNLLEAYDGALTSGANFRTFFEWFRNREDLENEHLKYKDSGDFEYPDRQLHVVRTALTSMLPEFSDFSVRRNPLRMVVYKDGEELWINQLSDGEKCLIATIGDLARRLAIANPTMENPLNGEGIVLIDEVDLHLHPAWQRMVVTKLNETFPNCQFIISTHSPQVLGEVESANIFQLFRTESGIQYKHPLRSYGLSSSDILDEYLGGKPYNNELYIAVDKINSHIDNENFEEARRLLEECEAQYEDAPILVTTRTMLEFSE